MKTLMFVFVTMLVSQAFAQYENTSFYFSIENIKDEDRLLSFKNNEVGFYSINEDQRRTLIVDQDSISVRSGFEIVIPKKEAIQKGFTFEDGKMFGMEPYNGVHYEEVNDTIVALYFQFDHYFGENDLIIIGKKGYFLFTPETDELFSCEYISFSPNEINIFSIDHVDQMKAIQKITDLEKAKNTKLETYIANPTLKELEQLVKKDCFNDLRSYPKVEHL
ncbi:hypothetical protein [Parvicella tangerina]|uniref:GLPGLI family protein n=1 Tax=Parvicella tangerina TaxID=2829795 RepID=A0A916JQ86_9FLAO|nr:hypothetical protein [Parvicella tangerina]CAG5085614.1 hypothetical protein CRYO30217_02814 [Parvicella tangerina]